MSDQRDQDGGGRQNIGSVGVQRVRMLLDFPQQHTTAIGADLPAVELTNDFAPL